jgi:hypothetical protein
MKLKVMFLASLLLLSVIAMSTEPVEALPFDNEYVDQSLGVGEYDSYWIDLTSGDVISGYYETDDTTMGLDFFIADDVNYDLWISEGGGTGYEVATNMHANWFSLAVPSTDTWWIVFINNDDATVWYDAAVDINGENYPTYSDPPYDFVDNDIIIDEEEWYYAFGTYDAGTEFDIDFEVYFSTDPIDFFICDESNYNIWDSGGTPSVYRLTEDVTSGSISNFVAPSSGTWYFVFSNVDGIDTVTISLGIMIDTSGATGTGTTDTGTTEPPASDGIPMWTILMAGV